MTLRTQDGAACDDVREIPCAVIECLAEDSEAEHREELAAEVARRERDGTWADHAYGVGHRGVGVIGCDHASADVA